MHAWKVCCLNLLSQSAEMEFVEADSIVTHHPKQLELIYFLISGVLQKGKASWMIRKHQAPKYPYQLWDSLIKFYDQGITIENIKLNSFILLVHLAFDEASSTINYLADFCQLYQCLEEAGSMVIKDTSII